MPGRFFPLSVRPNVVPATAAKKAPSTIREPLLQVATFHSRECTPICVPEIPAARASWASSRLRPWASQGRAQIRLPKLAERENLSVDELLSRHLLDLAGAESIWLSETIPQFSSAMRWPEP